MSALCTFDFFFNYVDALFRLVFVFPPAMFSRVKRGRSLPFGALRSGFN